jgi:transcriptional regulator with XRE-family HTH domain
MINPQAQTTLSWPDWLKSQMAERRVTANELAIVLGTEPSVVTEWLTGQTTPSVDALDNLAAVLGLDRAVLEERVGVVSPSRASRNRHDPFREILARVEAAAADL